MDGFRLKLKIIDSFEVTVHLIGISRRSQCVCKFRIRISNLEMIFEIKTSRLFVVALGNECFHFSKLFSRLKLKPLQIHAFQHFSASRTVRPVNSLIRRSSNPTRLVSLFWWKLNPVLALQRSQKSIAFDAVLEHQKAYHVLSFSLELFAIQNRMKTFFRSHLDRL